MDSVFSIQPLETTEVYNRLLVMTISLSEPLKAMVMLWLVDGVDVFHCVCVDIHGVAYETIYRPVPIIDQFATSAMTSFFSHNF